MGKSVAIIIATANDGTQSVVDGLMTRSEARAKLPTIKDEGFKKVELFDLRRPAKRRKLNRVVSEPESSPPKKAPAKKAAKKAPAKTT